ncbi:hypothetical protein F4678DRAFT_484989 [Xylaria arbuscula]|nr:hypothetical protein F4678DRAFT_484989 [Xylaria arbuscula]
MEETVCEAVEYLKQNPSAKLTTVARSFGLARSVLRNRAKGRGGDNRPPSANLKIKPIEEEAICNYIDRHEFIQAEVVADFANRILKAKAHPLVEYQPTVGKNWVRWSTTYDPPPQPSATPTPPPSRRATEAMSSSHMPAPTSLEHVNKAASHIVQGLLELENIDINLALKICGFIKGAIQNATELLQVQVDLANAAKNAPPESEGVSTGAVGRQMVQQPTGDEVAEARRIIEASEQRYRKAAKHAFNEAAKTARKWRLSGQLSQAVIWDGCGGAKVLRRF